MTFLALGEEALGNHSDTSNTTQTTYNNMAESTITTTPAPINPAQPMPTFKVVLVGRGQTGKTCLVHRLLTGEHRAAYIATLGVEVHPFRFKVKGSDGVEKAVCFNLWDTAGQEKFGGLRDGYYIQAQAAVIFVNPEGDRMKRTQEIATHARDLMRVVGKIPTFVAASIPPNKEKEWEFKEPSYTLKPADNWVNVVGTCLVCPRSNLNIMRPFLVLARTLLGDPTLELAPMSPRQPAKATVNRVEVYKRALECKRAEFEEACQTYAGALMDEGRIEEANRIMEMVPLSDEI